MHRLTDEEVWLRVLCACLAGGRWLETGQGCADELLPEFRKRFPAPPKPSREDMLKAMKGILGGQGTDTELTEPTTVNK